MTHTHHHTNPCKYPDPLTEIIPGEIKLEEGEIICNECDGKGIDTHGFFSMVCPKCQGEKKLDWISAATGVAPKPNPSDSSPSSSGYGIPSYTYSYGTSGVLSNTGIAPSHNHTIDQNYHSKVILDEDDVYINDKSIKEYISDAVITELSQKLANTIDKEILETYIKQTEQTLNTKRRKLFGNRIFSKLLFFFNFKQRFKNKKDKNII
jgi:hypothetical protein